MEEKAYIEGGGEDQEYAIADGQQGASIQLAC
jgi:hypothetical protein